MFFNIVYFCKVFSLSKILRRKSLGVDSLFQRVHLQICLIFYLKPLIKVTSLRQCIVNILLEGQYMPLFQFDKLSPYYTIIFCPKNILFYNIVRGKCLKNVCI